MDDSLKLQRRNLILISVLLIGIELSGADISKISILGLNFATSEVKRPDVIYYLIWSIWLWFTVRFIQYLTFEAGNDVADYRTRWLGALLLDSKGSQHSYLELVSLAMTKLTEVGRFGNTIETYQQIKLCVLPAKNKEVYDINFDFKFDVFFVERINEKHELAKSLVYINKNEYKQIVLKSWFFSFIKSPLGTDYYAPILIGFAPLIALIVNRMVL